MDVQPSANVAHSAIGGLFYETDTSIRHVHKLQMWQGAFMHGGQAVDITEAVWERASNALAAGGAALTPSAAAAAFQQVKLKAVYCCKMVPPFLCLQQAEIPA